MLKRHADAIAQIYDLLERADAFDHLAAFPAGVAGARAARCGANLLLKCGLPWWIRRRVERDLATRQPWRPAKDAP